MILARDIKNHVNTRNTARNGKCSDSVTADKHQHERAMDTKHTVRADDFTCFCTYCTKHEVQFCAPLISEYVRTLFSFLVPYVPECLY